MLEFMEMILELICLWQLKCIYNTKDKISHDGINHIGVKYYYVHDIIAQGKLKVLKISTQDNLADTITKTVIVAKSWAVWYNCLTKLLFDVESIFFIV
jgi:hypothetical protein